MTPSSLDGLPPSCPLQSILLYLKFNPTFHSLIPHILIEHLLCGHAQSLALRIRC